MWSRPHGVAAARSYGASTSAYFTAALPRSGGGNVTLRKRARDDVWIGKRRSRVGRIAHASHRVDTERERHRAAKRGILSERRAVANAKRFEETVHDALHGRRVALADVELSNMVVVGFAAGAGFGGGDSSGH